MQSLAKSRFEQLQEWKELKAARGKQGSSLANNGKPPLHSAKVSNPSNFVRTNRPTDKENDCDARQPSETSCISEHVSVDANRVRPALPTAEKVHMEKQIGILEDRLQAMKRDNNRPSLNNTGLLDCQQNQSTDEVAKDMESARDITADAAGTGQVGGLVARLDALKRESVRPSFAGPQPQFEAAGCMDMNKLSKFAQQLFNDAQFLQLCDKGMSSQLTRSRDGATEETKIRELAGVTNVCK